MAYGFTPVIEHRATLSEVHVAPPGDAVATYPSNVPYELPGRSHDTTKDPLAAETETFVGDSESCVAGVVVFGITPTDDDDGDEPVLFLATTVIV